MPKRRDAVSPDTKKRALSLLASGVVALPELAQVMGVSTQSIWNWCRAAKLDWRKARLAYVMKLWGRGHK